MTDILPSISDRAPTWWMELFSSSVGDWYAVLDAARAPGVLDLLRRSGHRAQSLYTGSRAELLGTVAPYLVEMPKDSNFHHQLWKYAWGNDWGIFIASNVGFVSTRKHLRRFLRVVIPDGRKGLFRFYDPRVLRAYLHTCSTEDFVLFHGPITCFICEHEEDESAVIFRAQERR
jgi:hypothetical protein